MSELQPTIRSVSGVGKPRLIVVHQSASYTSAGATTYTATTIKETGVTDWLATAVRVGMRVVAHVTGGGGVPDKPTYAKVTKIEPADTLIVDAWTQGTPTNGQQLRADGWIADLPRTQDMTEIFTPDQLVHRVYFRRRRSKFYGWDYACLLDYSRFLSADAITDIRRQLTPKETDRLILIPRVDKQNLQYNVLFLNAIELSLFGISAGHRKFVLSFQGKELVSFPTASGYGTLYATNYGANL